MAASSSSVVKKVLLLGQGRSYVDVPPWPGVGAVVLLSLMMMAPAEAQELGEGGAVPSPALSSPEKCPVKTVKLEVCADVLIHAAIPSANNTEPCCSLISGLADLDTAVCVCLAINAGVLGIDLDVDLDLTLLVNFCGRKCPLISSAPTTLTS